MNMIERVSRAIFRTTFHPDEDEALVEEKWNEWTGDQPRFRRQARAAIEELREPTEAMCELGWRKADERDAILGNGEIAMIWQAMIDEALKPAALGEGE